MTVTDKATATDAPCMCGCAKWDHKQGRATCKHCGCDTYDPVTFHEVERLRDQVAALEQVVDVLTAERDAVVTDANQAHNTNAKLRQRVEYLEREAVHAALQVDEAREQRNKAQAQAAELAQLRQERDDLLIVNRGLNGQIADAEAALVEANDARRMRDTSVHHERIAKAALVIGRYPAYQCLRCGSRYHFDDVDHSCGELTPVDVIIARRPKEQP